MFKNVIVRKPGVSISKGISSNPSLGKPNYEKALQEHENYVETLISCGVKATILEPLHDFPDSCFVEDVSVLTKDFAIIANPGVESRNKETLYIKETLLKFYSEDSIYKIDFPATLDGGDIMMIDKTFYIGLSNRTNIQGIEDFKEIVSNYGYEVIPVSLKEVLHLKTGVNYIGNNTLLVSGEFVSNPLFESFDKIIVPEGEEYAANCILVNEVVIIPSGYPKLTILIENSGFKTLLTDTSEFKKIDGGLSCLSLRF